MKFVMFFKCIVRAQFLWKQKIANLKLSKTFFWSKKAFLSSENDPFEEQNKFWKFENFRNFRNFDEFSALARIFWEYSIGTKYSFFSSESKNFRFKLMYLREFLSDFYVRKCVRKLRVHSFWLSDHLSDHLST